MDFSQLIFKNLDDKYQILVLFIDYSKAFDLLEHKVIIESLQQIGIGGKVLDWFASYLKRKFCLKLWGKVGSARGATGVPQGSVLGPLLYLIYTNSINSIISSNSPYSHVFLC